MRGLKLILHTNAGRVSRCVAERRGLLVRTNGLYQPAFQHKGAVTVLSYTVIGL